MIEGYKYLNTAQRLEVMTDEGKFELLATSVMRKHNPQYAAILHIGVNAEGKTVPSALDGFCLIPNSNPPHFLLVEHTTTKRGNLEKKWLHDHTTVQTVKSLSTRKTKLPTESDDGDLIKAGHEADKLRKVFPNAKFTVILTTNQTLSTDLAGKVYQKAGELGVSVDFWEQSRIADFLDTTAEGHYLRKEYLGVEAEMLSQSLLRDLCQRSLELYEQELLLTSPSSLVFRGLVCGIEEGQQSRIYAIQLLVGKSGSGKTVLAYQTFQNHLNSGRYGLWFPAELIKDCISIQDAVGRVLRAFQPSLLPDAGEATMQLLQQEFQLDRSQFIIFVDDLNRVEDPSRLLRKLITWAKPKESDSSEAQQGSLPLLIVCPVWPSVRSAIVSYLDKTSWAHSVYVDEMTSAEAQAAIQTSALLAGFTITEAEANSVSEKLGRDAILIGLYTKLLTDTGQVVPEDVVEQYIAEKINQVSIAPNVKHLNADYWRALESLTSKMLQTRNLYPLWSEVTSWFQTDSNGLGALQELTRHGQLCRLTEMSGKERFTFRHDRIRDNLLMKSVVKSLDDFATDSSVLWEPYFAEIVGQALLRSPQDHELLKRMREKLPLALAAAIQHFGTPTSRYHSEIIEEMKEWATINVKTGSAPNSVLNAMCWSFLQTDSPAVLEITEPFPKYWSVLLARVRNGCAKSGVLYCSRRADSEFTVRDSLRDRIIEQAKHRHEERLVQQLRLLLTDPDATDRERRGALAMAGFLEVADFQDEIAICWEHATDKSVVLTDAIWAAIRCCKDELAKLLDPMMAYWASLPDDENSRKSYIAELLRFGLRDVDSGVVNYFVNYCSIYESLRRPITYLCGFIDSPNALEFAIREAARMEHTGKFAPWVVSLHDNWNDRRTDRKLSESSLSHLRSLWEAPGNDRFVRRRAFLVWLMGAGWDEIDILRSIPTDSPLSRDAIRKRAQLGDQSVVPDLCPILLAKDYPFDTYFFDVAHHVWCDEIRKVAEYHLESFKDNIPIDFSGGRLNAHYHLSRFLMMIPERDSEVLLDKYWSHLGYSGLFIQTALYVGTPKCLELADTSIKHCPGDVPILERLSSHFGYIEVGRMEYFTADHVQRLQLYLDRLDEHTLRDLADACQRFGIVGWSQQHLASRLSDRWRKHYHPTDDDLLQDLDEIATDERFDEHYCEWRVTLWLEEFERRHDPRDRALNLVERWLSSHSTCNGLQIAAACIANIGTRNDLAILDEYEVEASKEEAAKIIASARFAVYRRTLN